MKNNNKSLGYICGEIVGAVILACLTACVSGGVIALALKFLLWIF